MAATAERGVRFAIVADDLTGATTTAALLAARGVRNTVSFDDACGVGFDSVESLLVSTESRNLAPEPAMAAVRTATESLVSLGASHFAKRTDTTMRGGVGFEIDAMLDVLGDDYMAVIVPALPTSRRIVVAGYSLIDSVLLANTGVSKDPFAPVTQSHLPTLLNEQLRQPCAAVGVDVLLQGLDALKQRLKGLKEAGARAIVLDAVSGADIELIARAVTELGWKTLCVDPGYFTTEFALAQGIKTVDKAPKAPLRVDSADDDRGTVVVVAGSSTDVTCMQLTNVAAVPGSLALALNVEAVITGGQLLADEVERARKLLQDSQHRRVVIVTLDSTLDRRRLDLVQLERELGLDAGQASARLNANLAAAVRSLLPELQGSLAGFYATGGDTLAHLCGALDAQGLALEDFVIPQSDQGRIVGGPFDGVPLVGKGGLTGGPHTAIQIVNRIFDERTLR